jgi:hypothetical protein
LTHLSHLQQPAPTPVPTTATYADAFGRVLAALPSSYFAINVADMNPIVCALATIDSPPRGAPYCLRGTVALDDGQPTSITPIAARNDRNA